MGRGDLLFAVTDQDIERGDPCCLWRSPLAFALARYFGGPATFYGYYVRSWSGLKYALPLSAIRWWELYKATKRARPGAFVLIPAEFDIHATEDGPEKGPTS